MRWLCDAFENEGALSLAETARLFGEAEALRIAQLAEALAEAGHVQLSPDKSGNEPGPAALNRIVRVASGRAELDVMLALLGEEDVAAVLRGLDWSVALDESPGLRALVSRVLRLGAAAKAAQAEAGDLGLRPTRLSVQTECISVSCRWRARDTGENGPGENDAGEGAKARRAEFRIHLTPTRPDAKAFIQGRRVSVSHDGLLPPGLLAHLTRVSPLLDAYRFKDLRDRLLKAMRA